MGGILFSFLYVPGWGGNSYFSQLVLILPWEDDDHGEIAEVVISSDPLSGALWI